MKFKLAQPQFIYELGKRKNQEDNIFPTAGEATTDSRLFIVCDGMGGHESGEVASKTVCEALSEYILSNVTDDTIFTETLFENALDYAYKQLDEKDTGNSQKQMGTTMTLIFFHKGGCFMSHIGDSRIYHIRPSEKKIKYISRDHSLVFDLFRIGIIKYEEMQTHPKRNIINKAMMPGEDNRVNADIVNTTDIQPGDIFYLCSDGMIELMDESDILGILSSDNTDEVKCQRLKSATLDNSDNHSAYIVKVDDVIMEGEEETYRNDEQTSRSNTVNYIPKLNEEEVTKINTGNFKSDSPNPDKTKKLFPWVKIMLVLIAVAFVGLFIVPQHLKRSQKYTMDKQGKIYQDENELTDEEVFVYGQQKDTTNKSNNALGVNARKKQNESQTTQQKNKQANTQSDKENKSQNQEAQENNSNTSNESTSTGDATSHGTSGGGNETTTTPTTPAVNNSAESGATHPNESSAGTASGGSKTTTPANNPTPTPTTTGGGTTE